MGENPTFQKIMNSWSPGYGIMSLGTFCALIPSVIHHEGDSALNIYHGTSGWFNSGPITMALVLAIAVTTGVTPANASGVSPLTVPGPVALEFSVQPLEVVRTVETTTVDIAAVRAEDQQREEAGLAPRFALTETVNIAPDTDGTWETLDSRHDLWRLRITSPGALSINLGFTGYRLPKGARLTIYPADASGPTDPRGVRNFTNGDNDTHSELWTPVVVSDDIVLELMMPRESRQDYVLELTAINKGYRFFGEILGDVTDKS